MPDRKRPRSSNYRVGYGRPPTATQFKAGQSGNPKGRPKGPRSVGAVLRSIIRQRVSVTENGRTRRLPVLDVMLLRLVKDAMRDDPKALKFLLALVERYAEPDAEPHREEVAAEDHEILMHFLQQSTVGQPGTGDDE